MTLRHTTLGMLLWNSGSPSQRLYLTTSTLTRDKRHVHVSARFKTSTTASDLSHACASDRAATGIGLCCYINK